jgi:DMSO/TMAO reductase YedYZ molybdopterin-dependent catalytic subunit
MFTYISVLALPVTRQDKVWQGQGDRVRGDTAERRHTDSQWQRRRRWRLLKEEGGRDGG